MTTPQEPRPGIDFGKAGAQDDARSAETQVYQPGTAPETQVYQPGQGYGAGTAPETQVYQPGQGYGSSTAPETQVYQPGSASAPEVPAYQPPEPPAYQPPAPPQYPAGGVYGYPPVDGLPTGTPPTGYPQQPSPYDAPPAYPAAPAYPPAPAYPAPPAYPAAPGYPAAPAYPAAPQSGGYAPYGPYAPTQTQTLSIISFVCLGLSLIGTALCFFPILLTGPAGIILGFVGHSKGESLGKWAAIANAVVLVLAILLVVFVIGIASVSS
ncbi:hypothetical protein [Nocardia sp. bgisy134]|uniref:hypothetical protein n=1 Tax=Nocardia sp. bgisy134 TaxID=3413789 RepID=UPI003D751D69